ncbi:MAG: RNA-guided pseudouridylation complex pseudouridine synthase subunit Cbf5 [Bdellovibrio sp.]|nr:MAG: RNA-guided pseudouridylation complex pseudouridine synthase subunit Cbf5 [Bdellovibrio sp.]
MIITKKEAETSNKYGSNPYKRPVPELINTGIFIADKPRGPTSHQTSAYVKQILGLKKTGHSGTLDPNVTGVLPIALGRATRIVQALVGESKEYVGIMHVHKSFEEYDLRKTISEFTGKISQLPPIKSSVKRQWRKRTVYKFEILEIEEKDILFRVLCEAGTYIRKLVHDIGQKLGAGAHMTELRRTKAGPFTEKQCFILQDLVDAYHYYKNEGNEKFIRAVIRPIEEGVQHLRKVFALDSAVNTICHGADLSLPGISKYDDEIKAGEQVAVMTLKDELVALGVSKIEGKNYSKQKGIAVNVRKVFMLPGTYPKISS